MSNQYHSNENKYRLNMNNHKQNYRKWRIYISVVAQITIASIFQMDSVIAQVNVSIPTRMEYWLESSLNRIYPKSNPNFNTQFEIIAARNSRISFQVGFRNNSTEVKMVNCAIKDADMFTPRVRFVGLVPLYHLTPGTELKELEGSEHLPGLVPDPLYELTTVQNPPYESRSFWVTLNIPSDIDPGIHHFKVLMTVDGKVSELPVKVEISKLVIKPRKDFDVIHWWRGEATWDYYKLDMFEERWWALTKKQIENMVDHGTNVMYTPIFFNRREVFKRPCQLLIVDEPQPGKYKFDWTRVKRFVDMAKGAGVEKFEWSHLWIYLGVENPMRIYKEKGGKYEMLWSPDISGTSDTYINFLKQFLPEFHSFLKKEGILQTSYFHLSDEPGMTDDPKVAEQHILNYKAAREILQKYAPWMKVMDALSDIRYGRQKLTDIPIPLVASAQAYIDEQIPHWVYYCCVPRGDWLNRFMDTPLAKIRMSGWLFYRLRAKGFLHWGFNYWHKIGEEKILNPFTENDGGVYPGTSAGDAFVVYPSEDGVLDAIRWEVFAESLQDYSILQTAGINPDDLLLSSIKSYAQFPKNEHWIRETLISILRNAK